MKTKIIWEKETWRVGLQRGDSGNVQAFAETFVDGAWKPADPTHLIMTGLVKALAMVNGNIPDWARDPAEDDDD